MDADMDYRYIPFSLGEGIIDAHPKGPVTHYRCTSPGLNRSTQLTTARKSAELRREST